MDPNNLLRLSYWLDPAATARRAGPAMWGVVLIGLVWISLALALHRRGRITALDAAAQALAGALAAGVACGRLFAVPGLGWRIGWLLAAAVGLLSPLLLSVIRRRGLIDACIEAIAFRPGATAGSEHIAEAWPFSLALAWLALQLAGVIAVISINRWPWRVAGLFAAIAAGPWLIRALIEALRGRSPAAALNAGLCALAPLAFVPAVVAIRVAISIGHRFVVGGYIVPEPWSTIFNPTLWLIAMLGYACAAGWRAAARDDVRFVRLGALGLILATLGWAALTGLRLHTHGVTGSDPYAYTQMGVDLATRGTVFHAFPLARMTYALNIPTDPVIHIGYRLPADVTRLATTVWPPGYAVFTAAAYRLAGEEGVYALAPLLSLLSLGVAMAWLWPLTADWKVEVRLAALALMAALTATSYQQVEWQLIPMADIGAQLFSLLAVALVLGRSSLPRAALAGLCIGIAFDVRYTQVLIAPAVALAIWLQRDLTPGQRGAQIVLGGLAAGLAALPVLLYHQAAFGSPFQTGSDELRHFSLASAPGTLWRTLSELSLSNELGLVWPWIGLGTAWLFRRDRRRALICAAYVLPVLGLHALYSYLRPRDLLSLLPVMYMLAALGIVAMARGLAGRASRMLSIAAIAALSLLCVQRSIVTLMLPYTRGFSTFGYLVREQRQSFDQLRALTPEGAIVGGALNSGAIDLFAGRSAFRPAGWTPGQLLKFVALALEENTPVFVIDDGKELAQSLATLRASYRLDEVGRIDVPFYFPDSGGSENRNVPVYRVVLLQP